MPKKSRCIRVLGDLAPLRRLRHPAGDHDGAVMPTPQLLLAHLDHKQPRRGGPTDKPGSQIVCGNTTCAVRRPRSANLCRRRLRHERRGPRLAEPQLHPLAAPPRTRRSDTPARRALGFRLLSLRLPALLETSPRADPPPAAANARRTPVDLTPRQGLTATATTLAPSRDRASERPSMAAEPRARHLRSQIAQLAERARHLEQTTSGSSA